MFRSLRVRSPRGAAHALFCAARNAKPHLSIPTSHRRSRLGSHLFEALEERMLLSVNVSTYHYSNSEYGSNSNETQLTLSNVNTSTFGKIASFSIDGQSYGQPLVMTNIAMGNGQGTHDIVLVTTENDSVYAFDAYGNNPAQGYLWKTSLLQTGETPASQVGDYSFTTDITPSVGITGTPVIDQTTNTLYVVGLFKESDATFQQRLYAINISTGTNAISPVVISGSISGSTYSSSPNYPNTGGTVTFSAFYENQRPALTLANGEVYIAWASHGDQNPWHGWVMGYNESTLHQDYIYCTTLNGTQGGIWMSGGGLAVDSSGDLYFTTGNGTFDAGSGGVDYGMAMEKLSPSLQVLDYFSPYDESSLSNSDLDFGCSNVILLPTQPGATPDQVLSAGKWGTIFLNNSDTGSLGEYSSTTNKDLGQANITTVSTTNSVVHQTLAYWNGLVYLAGDGYPITAFQTSNMPTGMQTSSAATTPYTQTARNFGNTTVEDGQGAGLTISSNGTSNGILWALDNSGFNSNPAVLYAYNANNLSQLLWSSNQAANNRDTAGNAVKFQDPVVANGCVYVAGSGSVTVYGAIQVSTSAPTITTPASATPSPVTGSTTVLNVSATDVSGDLAPIYNWTATTVPSGATTPTFSANATNTANLSTATFSLSGSYTLQVTVTDPNSMLSVTSSVTVIVQQTLTSTSLSPTTATVNNNGTVQFTALAYDQFGKAMTTQPSFTYSVLSGGVGGTINPATGLYTAPASGLGTDTIQATSGSNVYTSVVTVALPSGIVQANLSSYYNRVGIVSDGTTFATTAGADGGGAALSANLLGSSQTYNGSSFVIPAPNSSNTVNNIIASAGQTILLPQHEYQTIELLGFHVNGAARDTITLNYSGGTSTNLQQNYSDWFTPAGYTGESKVATMVYRDEYTGAIDNRTFYVYGYKFNLTGTKTVTSITLPSDANFEIVAIDLVNVYTSTAASATPSTVTGTTSVLNMAAKQASGDAAPIYTWSVMSKSTGAPTPTFSTNTTTTSNSSTVTFYQAGFYTLLGAAYDSTSGLYATSTVQITVTQTMTSIAVSPAGPSGVVNGHTLQFSATANDQFSLPMAVQPTFNWAVASGSGSVDSTGLYTAPPVGTGSATITASSGLVSGSGFVSIGRPSWIGAGSAATWNSASQVLTVTGATTIVADPGSDQPIIMGNSSSDVVTINPSGTLQIHLGGLSLTNGARAIVTSLGVTRSATNHRVLVLGTPGSMTAPTFIVDSSSQLDLTDNDLLDHAGSAAAIFQMVQRGLNAGGAYWNGSGIISGKAAAGQLFALGVSPAAAAGSFDGEAVTTSDVEVRYTYYGDATLDGTVNTSDYTLIDNGYLKNLTGFNNGDFNYDNIINGSDYTLIDNAFNTQSASLAAQLAGPGSAGINQNLFASNVYPSSTDAEDERKNKLNILSDTLILADLD